MWTNGIWVMERSRRTFGFGTWTTECMVVVIHQYKKFQKQYIERQPDGSVG